MSVHYVNHIDGIKTRRLWRSFSPSPVHMDVPLQRWHFFEMRKGWKRCSPPWLAHVLKESFGLKFDYGQPDHKPKWKVSLRDGIGAFGEKVVAYAGLPDPKAQNVFTIYGAFRQERKGWKRFTMNTAIVTAKMMGGEVVRSV